MVPDQLLSLSGRGDQRLAQLVRNLAGRVRTIEEFLGIPRSDSVVTVVFESLDVRAQRVAREEDEEHLNYVEQVAEDLRLLQEEESHRQEASRLAEAETLANEEQIRAEYAMEDEIVGEDEE